MSHEQLIGEANLPWMLPERVEPAVVAQKKREAELYEATEMYCKHIMDLAIRRRGVTVLRSRPEVFAMLVVTDRHEIEFIEPPRNPRNCDHVNADEMFADRAYIAALMGFSCEKDGFFKLDESLAGDEMKVIARLCEIAGIPEGDRNKISVTSFRSW